MKGLKLSSLTGELKKVTDKYQAKPASTIRTPAKKISGAWKNEVRERELGKTFLEYYPLLPLPALSEFSFDELCKMKYSSIFMMHDTVRKLFETKARYEIVRKIISSMWRWGCGSKVWNEVVDAYEHIRNFVFSNDPNFEIRLDHSTYFNECGRAKYSRIFIDGVFAYLVYYKKKHVMTIGFSIMEGRRILIQQVQGAERSGNRYLYRLPANRLEFVIELFQKNFPGYKLYVIEGRDLVKKTISSYRRGLEESRKSSARYEEEIKNSTSEPSPWVRKFLKESQEDCDVFIEKISHLNSDAQRLDAFYRDTGRFTLQSKALTVNNLTHREVS